MNLPLIAAVVLAMVAALVFMQMKSPKGYTVRALSAKELAAEKAVVVDIRRPDEWAATGVIKGAKLITFTNADQFLAALGPVPAGSPLVIICRSGARSGAAAAALKGRVDAPIISYQGGMTGWIAAKGQIVNPK